jgi:galactokinase
VRKILSGSTRGRTDTVRFLELLSKSETVSGVTPAELFDPAREIVVARAPGRLDLMGGIADYSGSLVLELPIEAATHAAVQTMDAARLEIISLPPSHDLPARRFAMLFDELADGPRPIEYEAARVRFSRDPEDHWASYVAGAFLVLVRELGLAVERGARLVLKSDVPEGKGVSSSASLEVAAMQAIAAAYGVALEPQQLAMLCQRVENLVAGAPCGVMDQMTSACGEEGRLLALLCQPGELRGTIELPKGLAIWGVDSGIRHSVGGGDYGTVRAAAFMGYRMIAAYAGIVTTPGETAGRVVVDDPIWGGYLANIDPHTFEREYAARLPESMRGDEFLARFDGITDGVTAVRPDREYPVRAATRHPIHEHARVTRFASILETGDGLARVETLGELMYESHSSYSACGLGSSGTDEIVRLVRSAGPEAGLFGAKITGGGSGGTVAVLGESGAATRLDEIVAEYRRTSGNVPLVITGSSPGSGAFGVLRLGNQD